MAGSLMKGGVAGRLKGGVAGSLMRPSQPARPCTVCSGTQLTIPSRPTSPPLQDTSSVEDFLDSFLCAVSSPASPLRDSRTPQSPHRIQGVGSLPDTPRISLGESAAVVLTLGSHPDSSLGDDPSPPVTSRVHKTVRRVGLEDALADRTLDGGGGGETCESSDAAA